MFHSILHTQGTPTQYVPMLMWGAVEVPRRYPAQEGITVRWNGSETFKLQQDQSTRRDS